MLQYIGIPSQQTIIHPYKKQFNKDIIILFLIMVRIFVRSLVFFLVFQVYLIDMFSIILFSEI